jgi:GNAT superfamily N-acetyltransferase
MNTQPVISTLNNDYCNEIIDLILPIQQIEFNVPVTIEDQPDLSDIETNYHQTGGGFWGALQEGQLVGTIALISIGDGAGAIRKMFVRKEFRGKELRIAQRLFDNMVTYCKNNGIVDLYLGTVNKLEAAIRFYERNGFVQLNKTDLPASFPIMSADNVFFHLHLNN